MSSCVASCCTCSPRAFRSYPLLRPPRQPLPLHATAPVLRSTQHSSIADQTRNLHHPGIASSLALPQVRRTDGGHRTTYRRSTPTPFSATVGYYCRMKLLAYNSKTLHGSPRSAPVRLAPESIPTSRSLPHHLRPSTLTSTHSQSPPPLPCPPLSTSTPLLLPIQSP